MARYTATPTLEGMYDISEIDADGVGTRRYIVGVAGPLNGRKLAGQDLARLVVLALNLPGGIDEATILLRAEVTKHS